MNDRPDRPDQVICLRAGEYEYEYEYECFVADEAAEAARLAACEHCAGTGWITVRTRFPMSYVCAGSPPDYATGVCEARCNECHRWRS